MADPDGLARWKKALAANEAQKRNRRGKRAVPRTGAGMVRRAEKPRAGEGEAAT